MRWVLNKKAYDTENDYIQKKCSLTDRKNTYWHNFLSIHISRWLSIALKATVINLPFYEMKLRALLAFVGSGNMRYQLLSPGSTSPNVKSSWKHCTEESSIVHPVCLFFQSSWTHQQLLFLAINYEISSEIDLYYTLKYSDSHSILQNKIPAMKVEKREVESSRSNKIWIFKLCRHKSFP